MKLIKMFSYFTQEEPELHLYFMAWSGQRQKSENRGGRGRDKVEGKEKGKQQEKKEKSDQEEREEQGRKERKRGGRLERDTDGKRRDIEKRQVERKEWVAREKRKKGRDKMKQKKKK